MRIGGDIGRGLGRTRKSGTPLPFPHFVSKAGKTFVLEACFDLKTDANFLRRGTWKFTAAKKRNGERNRSKGKGREEGDVQVEGEGEESVTVTETETETETQKTRNETQKWPTNSS